MRTPLSRLSAVLVLAAASWSPVAAQQPLAEQVLEGCASELESYCAAVTPGEGRLLACLYAHGDKLSGQCDGPGRLPPLEVDYENDGFVWDVEMSGPIVGATFRF